LIVRNALLKLVEGFAGNFCQLGRQIGVNL